MYLTSRKDNWTSYWTRGNEIILDISLWVRGVYKKLNHFLIHSMNLGGVRGRHDQTFMKPLLLCKKCVTSREWDLTYLSF